jgi:hypothetical protein
MDLYQSEVLPQYKFKTNLRENGSTKVQSDRRDTSKELQLAVFP